MSKIGIDLAANDASAEFRLGTVMEHTDSAGTKAYKYIKFHEGASAAVVAEVVYYAQVATGDATGTIVTSDLSVSDETGAGVLQAALTDTYHGWIQVRGIATLAGALTAGADGDLLTPTGAGDGNLDLSALHTDDKCAVAIDATAFVIMCSFRH
jgi:hypothetical protein